VGLDSNCIAELQAESFLHTMYTKTNMSVYVCANPLVHVLVAACRNGCADGDEAVHALQGSCNSLQQLVHAAQQQVQQLEAAAVAASASAVVACVAAISEDSCEDEQDDDDGDANDVGTGPAAAAAAAWEMTDACQAGLLQAQVADEIECLSDDEQYCVQVQMGAQLAACASLQPAYAG
jgi:hypothetical protein